MPKLMVKTETLDGQPLLVDPAAVQAVSSSWHEDRGATERVDTAILHFVGYCVVIRWTDFQRHFRGHFEVR